MKPHYFIILLGIIYTLSGCTKTVKEQQPFTQAPLAQDTSFIKIVNLEQELYLFMLKLAETKGLTMLELKKKIQGLYDMDVKANTGGKLLNDFIGHASMKYLNEYANAYKGTWEKLNTKHPYISIQNIDEACKQLYAQRYNSITLGNASLGEVAKNSFLTVNKISECGWRYSLCIAAATAGSILCHSSCIGGTAGLGTPACIVLCGTIQAAAGVACIDNYCTIS